MNDDRASASDDVPGPDGVPTRVGDDVLSPRHAPPRGWGERLSLVLRGAVIGVVEIVPGVSGGTVALILGVYETLIRSAGHLVRAAVRGVGQLVGRGTPGLAAQHARQVRWGAVLPIVGGIAVAVVVGARVLEPFVVDHPVQSRALFAGLILASLVVPARMVGGRWTPGEVLVAAAAATTSFLLTGIPPAAEQSPTMPIVFIAAAVAICALVLPGISGSFLLLTVGLYQPTLAALNDRDLGYVGVFILGAVFGLSVFVTGLQWLLEHKHRITLVLLTGLMAGSLRALWPWQDDERNLLGPTSDVGPALALVAAGIVVVVALLLLERRTERRAAADGRHEAPEPPSV